MLRKKAMNIKQDLTSIGAKGGKRTSKAKAKAAKENGKLGGRPKKAPKAEKRPSRSTH